VNIAGGVVEVCRKPVGDDYASLFQAGCDATLEPELPPGVAIPVAALFG
jgi:hypothetical protein